jgi:4-hydroxy-L-threonine phosphate dehydrogenase PdxA
VTRPRIIAVPIGDPNGIGPEIAVKATAALAGRDDLRLILFGDPFVIDTYVREAGVPPGTIVRAVDALPAEAFVPGRICAQAGAATVDYVAAAVADLGAGKVDAIVAAPHSETAIKAAGIPFSGYPSLLARLMGKHVDSVFLMLIGGGLRIVHVTLHERLQDVLERLTVDLVEAAALAAIEALQALGHASPRVGLFGINPHAGEGGLFGDDDDRITVPAAVRLRSAGHNVEGPAGADVMLGRPDLDAFVAVYHDQGHIPVKLLAGRSASALSIGSGLLFSSTGHGSAFDIAGKNRADAEGIIRAIELVLGLARAPTSTPCVARSQPL